MHTNWKQSRQQKLFFLIVFKHEFSIPSSKFLNFFFSNLQMEWTHRLTVRLNILVLQPSFVSLVITVGELTLTSSPRFGSTGSYNSASFEGAEEPVYHPQYDNINMLRADQVDGLLAPEAQVINYNTALLFLVYKTLTQAILLG